MEWNGTSQIQRFIREEGSKQYDITEINRKESIPVSGIIHFLSNQIKKELLYTPARVYMLCHKRVISQFLFPAISIQYLC